MIVIMECGLLPSGKAAGACLRIQQAAANGRMYSKWRLPIDASSQVVAAFRKEKMQPKDMETKVYFGCQSCGAIYGAVQIKAENGAQDTHTCELCSAEVVVDSPDFQIRNWTRVKPLQSFSASAPQASNR
jgi:hypothetical protein